MRCPFSSHLVTNVKDSRENGEGDQVRRRRECVACGARFTSYETVELNLPRIIKSDNRREAFDEDKLRAGILRAVENEENSNLFRSSFSKGETGDPVTDWKDSCEPLEQGIKATIDRARRECIDLIVEGVHITPSNDFLREWRNEGGIAVGIVLHVRNKNTHLGLIKEREMNSWRTAQRYIESFERIRKIQDGILEAAIPYSWNTLDCTIEDAEAKVAHLLDVQWNQKQMKS